MDENINIFDDYGSSRIVVTTIGDLVDFYQTALWSGKKAGIASASGTEFYPDISDGEIRAKVM